MTIVDPSLGHGQHARQRGHHGRHEGEVPSRRAVLHPAVQHVVLARRPGRLPQLRELHPGASERNSCPLRPQRHLRRRGHEQNMAAEWATWPVTDLCEKNQAWTTGWHRLRAPRPTSCTPPSTCSRNRSNQSPLPKALWSGPWRKSRTKTTRQHRLDLT